MVQLLGPGPQQSRQELWQSSQTCTEACRWYLGGGGIIN